MIRACNSHSSRPQICTKSNRTTVLAFVPSKIKFSRKQMGLGMESDQTLFFYTLLTLFIISPPTFVSLHFLQAPYGKHGRPGWGPSVPAAVAWFLMESPTVWLTLLLFPLGRHCSHPRALALLAVFLFHYLHRTCIYPLRLRGRTAPRRGGFPVSIAAMAFAFNLLNSYVQARGVSHYADYGGDGWFWWRFAGGLAIFLSGMAVNVRSDLKLMSLKEKGGDGIGGYKVPRGAWFEVVSCPNYFGEIVEWLGWALMTQSWAGLAFFLYTCANLVPRARANHRWYLEKFGEDYPKGRKAVIPFLY
ncbi:steroid 5-alpha-reductase DET2 [Malania oleifera]|uniref:steroid 5-alpha-reductase DET2 n=1 Tax=Malania oleifera TaxID=397392 RepID=UPI0025AE8D8C|nr:steroid 5-alpha-reductase DET2 [Malania oleifera]